MNRRLPALAVVSLLCALAVARADDNPLAKSKTGEWLIQKNVIGGGAMTMGVYMFVTKVDGKKVTIATQPLNEDMKTPSGPARTHDPSDTEKPLPANKDDKKVGEEEIEVKGKKLRCKKTESTTETKEGRLVTTTWTSSEVPVFGIVRQVVKDKDGKEILRSELVDWGADGGKEKPLAAEKDKSEKDKNDKDPKGAEKK